MKTPNTLNRHLMNVESRTGKWNYFFDGGGAKGLIEGITVGILGMAGSGGSVTFGSVGGRGGNAAGFGKVCGAVGSVGRVMAGNGGSAAGLGMVGIGGRAVGLGRVGMVGRAVGGSVGSDGIAGCACNRLRAAIVTWTPESENAMTRERRRQR